jgi:hypothetical protein
MGFKAMWGCFGVGEVWGVDWDIGRVVGDFGGRDSRSERFGDLNDIDIRLLNIDWIGSLGDPNDKKINHPEVTCWSLDFTGASGEAWVPIRMKISGDIDIALF